MGLICPANVWKMVISVGIGHFLGVVDRTGASRLRIWGYADLPTPDIDLNHTVVNPVPSS
jgi:hypothetical protein